MIDLENDPYIPHTIIEVGVVRHTASLTLMCNYVKFYVKVDAADLGGDQADHHIREEFLALCNDWDERIDELEDWITLPCFPVMGRLAPRPDTQKVFTLEEYFDPPTFYLRLKVIDSTLVTEEFEGDPSSPHSFPRRMALAQVESALPEAKKFAQESAAKFEIIPNIKEGGFEYCGMPLRVRKGRYGHVIAFKAAAESGSILRELEAYSKLAEARCKASVPMPEFYDLVTIKGELLGFTMEFINHKATMHYRAADASQTEKERWFEQISQAVKYLHTLGLIWSDVKPDNVLIREDGNAQVIDFGGGFSPDWVDKELAGTKAGDLQGLDRLKAFLGC